MKLNLMVKGLILVTVVSLTSCVSKEELQALEDENSSLAEKLEYADSVIDNSGVLEETRRQVERVWNELRKLLN